MCVHSSKFQMFAKWEGNCTPCSTKENSLLFLNQAALPFRWHLPFYVPKITRLIIVSRLSMVIWWNFLCACFSPLLLIIIIATDLISLNSIPTHGGLLHYHFTVAETEGQRWEAVCPKFYSCWALELGGLTLSPLHPEYPWRGAFF